MRGNVAKRQKGCALPKGRLAGGLSDTRKLVFVSGTYAWKRSESQRCSLVRGVKCNDSISR